MPYSSEVIARARQRMESEKADRLSKYYANLEQAYRDVPRLQQIDRKMKQNMAVAVQGAFAKDTAAMSIEQAKQENFALQAEWDSPVKANFPAGYLDDSPACPLCGGSGYVGREMCACLQELCRQEQMAQLQQLTCGQGRFEDFRLDFYSDRVDPKIGVSARTLMEQNFRICKRFAQQFKGNLLFVGGTGLGKTFLSACIATYIAKTGHSVTYESAGRLFNNLEKCRFNPDETVEQVCIRYESCDLLIIDDLGTELPGAFVTAALYNLVNDRLLSGKSMVISTNLTIDEISRRYSPQIASRLQGDFQGLTFVGEDIRVLKNRGILV